MLSAQVSSLFLDVGDVMGLYFNEDGGQRLYSFRVNAIESPNNLREFSIGGAAARAAAGSGWNAIQNSSNAYLLQPPNEKYLYQVFYGISPSWPWVYRAYPGNVQRGGLQNAAAIGSTYGYLTGRDTPIDSPSADSEFFTTYNLSPSFAAYNPRALPSSVTTYMSFFIRKYYVDVVDGIQPKRAVTMGGIPPVETPSWIRDSGRRAAGRVA